MSTVLTKLLKQYPYEDWDFNELSRNPSFQIKWFELFPNSKWNLTFIIRNPNFKLEWIARYPKKEWNMNELNKRLAKGDVLIMPNVLAKIKNITSSHKLHDYNNNRNYSVGLDFYVLSALSFKRETKIMRRYQTYVYFILTKHIDKNFCQYVLLDYFR